jgi:ABC-type phosphate transport system substrate-binding protein
MKQQSSSIVTLALLLASGGTSINVSAQTAADNFPLPTSVASGTKVQIDGSSSMQYPIDIKVAIVGSKQLKKIKQI